MVDIIAPGGFQVDRFEETRAKFVRQWRDEFGPGAVTASTTPDGHIIDWGTSMAQACFERAEEAYQAAFVTTAGNISQMSQILGPLFNSFPRQATPSRGQILNFGVVGTLIFASSEVSSPQNGNVFAMASTEPIAQDVYLAFVFGPALSDTTTQITVGPQTYALSFPVTGTGLEVAEAAAVVLPFSDAQIVERVTYADGSGNGVLVITTTQIFISSVTSTNADSEVFSGSLMTAVANEAGPIEAEPFTISAINSPLTGWEGAVNLESVTIGSDQDTPARYLQRHLDTFGKNGGSSQIALSGILREFDGIEYLEIFNNPFNTVDADGRPPHSFEVVKLGGDDQEVALGIWENHPLGIQTVGQQSFLIEDSRTLQEHLIFLTNVQELFIWLQITLTPGKGFPTIPVSDVKKQARDNITVFGSLRGVGKDAYEKDQTKAMGFEGLKSCIIKMTTTTSPTGVPAAFATGNLTISNLQILRWLQTRIEVTVL